MGVGGILPDLGVGLGYRSQLHDRILEHEHEIDWLEVITDGYIGDPAGLRDLQWLRETFPIVPHSLEMSVGSEEPLDEDYLDGVAAVADAVDAPWVSDHLCFTRDGGIHLDSLAPVQRTYRQARRIAEKAQRIQDRLGRRFLLENITYYVDLPGELTEAEMISEVMRHCDCGILLDLNNVAVNARNHGYDPFRFLDALPLDRVEQVHLAGNTAAEGPDALQVDSHDDAVSDEVLRLLGHLLDRQHVKGILLERDDNFPDDFGEIVGELRLARWVVQSGPAR
ncbi:UPF0276 protein [Microtetraspora sp. NBRC 13810]|uniref:DUF692 domain-containing protein n=1 Tax=Microtetraspora sp. NBRC 13810 TaxID=3030990 RepID=UPI0024A21E92|nr:DUF692 domain-containing protein [Microtetraspora sp. NBRC 13810]GLW13008.1 UPF0276 protein [Microtetraspora sp. NBRC 13810]